MQETRNGLARGQELAAGIVHVHRVPFGACCEDGSVFVYAERAQRISAHGAHGTTAAAAHTAAVAGSLARISTVAECGGGGGGVDGVYALVHTHVPELDFTAAASAYELALAAALKVDVCDPLTMLFPDLDHCHGWFETLVVDADGAVAEAGDEDLALDLF